MKGVYIENLFWIYHRRKRFAYVLVFI